MKTIVKKNKKCLICGNSIIKYLDLGNQAFANSYIKKSDLKKKELKAPLQVLFCKKCKLAQLGNIVSRKHIFRDYAYLSSTSPQLESYFKEYTTHVVSMFPKQSRGLVVEVGSNDGILLKYFKKNGSNVLGIDPARNIAKIANKKGVRTIPEFFNTKTAKTVLRRFDKANIITANNVLAHTDNLHEILKGTKLLLDENGVCIFEVQYLYDLIKKNQFDNTYHEHVCYFSFNPLSILFNMYGLEIFYVKHTNAQGGSIRVFAGYTGRRKIDKSVTKFIQSEKKARLYNIETYKKFSKKPKELKNELVTLLKNLKKENKKIIGYGASAKGNTLLQYSKLDNKIIDYIVDTAKSKQGKFTPGTHIPIVPVSEIKNNIPDYVLILAWNYADSIIKKEAWLKKKGVKFIIPIPKVKIV
ncbi:MAG: class I SAM-dependent methyltransferase [Candidatus Pacebacteria bacterium]|nr:class I SAM-dependent methyltransferase [Candidatus Paceibacterota bacterium]